MNGIGSADTVILEPLRSALPLPPRQTITLSARDYLAANSLNVEAGGGLATDYGPDTLHNGPPYEQARNAAEWQFFANAAVGYWLEVEYAAAVSRPVTITVNGQQVSSNGLAEVTGGWDLGHQVWQRQLAV